MVGFLRGCRYGHVSYDTIGVKDAIHDDSRYRDTIDENTGKGKANYEEELSGRKCQQLERDSPGLQGAVRGAGGERGDRLQVNQFFLVSYGILSVSYTHLTLPTILLV